MESIAIVDYGAGNLRSVQKAFEHLGYSARFTSSPGDVIKASTIVFPGQGASPSAMAALERDGMANAIRQAVYAGTPFFGVCLGLQLLLERSDEGSTECLGVIPGRVKRFEGGLKVPHMGWNAVDFDATHPVFRHVPQGSYFYFVHSYYARPRATSWIAGSTNYGIEFASVLAKGNLIATQFHPEKSGAVGLKLYDNFMRYVVGKRS